MITFVTIHKGDRPDLLYRCVDSISPTLSLECNHVVICAPTREQWATERIKALTRYEYVAFVDDDDYIDPNTIPTLLNCIRTNNDVGIIFTNEATVRGDHIEHHTADRSYHMAALHPRAIHHLTVIKSKDVDLDFVSAKYRQHGTGLDWLIKADTALQTGAVHVPTTGYFWTQHETSMHVSDVKHQDASFDITRSLLTRSKYTGRIPTFFETV